MSNRLRLLTLWTVIFLSPSLQATEVLQLSTGIHYPFTDSADGKKGFITAVAREVFSRVGYNINVNILPSERALQNANSGIDDGQLLRIKGIDQRYTNLIRIPEKIFDTEFVGYAMPNSTISGEGWNRIASKRITFVNGWKIFERQQGLASEVHTVRNPEQLFSLLTSERSDIVLYERWQGLYQAKLANLTNLQTIEPPFATVEQFMYLHNKHSDLIAKASSALQQVKSDGTYAKLFQQLLAPLQ